MESAAVQARTMRTPGKSRNAGPQHNKKACAWCARCLRSKAAGDNKSDCRIWRFQTTPVSTSNSTSQQLYTKPRRAKKKRLTAWAARKKTPSAPRSAGAPCPSRCTSDLASPPAEEQQPDKGKEGQGQGCSCAQVTATKSTIATRGCRGTWQHQVLRRRTRDNTFAPCCPDDINSW